MLGSQVLMKPRRANAEKMRTYSRKRPEYKEIENVHNLCRLCLGKANEAISIFKNNESGDVCAAVALRIMICVGLEVRSAIRVRNLSLKMIDCLLFLQYVENV